MKDYLEKNKEKISSVLQEYFLQHQSNFSVNKWSNDANQKLLAFSQSGKMIRGNMVIFSYQLFKKDFPQDLLYTASAIEILHSGLLIHDDVMDNDILRRNAPTIFSQYAKGVSPESNEFGKNMAICVGDIAFFLSWQLFNKITSPKKSILLDRITQELLGVGYGQMQDVASSLPQAHPTKEDILNVYKWKTGRYTFSLPFLIGNILVGQKNKKTQFLLEQIGEDLGILFQIQDDRLGLFGKEKVIGKPVGSDIRENKKTLYWLYLFTKASSKEKENLNKIFGNQNITANDLDYVYDLIHTHNIQKDIETIENMLLQRLHESLKKIALSKGGKEALQKLIQYSLKRDK